MISTSILYDPETRDYRMEIEGKTIGLTPTYRESPVTVALGRLMFDMAARGEQPAKASWSTAMASADPPTPLPEDLPDPGPGGPGVPGDDRPRITNPAPKRFDLQTMLATQQQGLCLNCGTDHRTWQCPEIARELFPPVYATDELVRLWGASRALLVAKLARLTPGQLTSQAIAFAAWLNEQTYANLPARSVFVVWQEMLSDHSTALERTA